MKKASSSQERRPATANTGRLHPALRAAGICALALLAAAVSAQVITVNTHTGKVTNNGEAPVDRRFAQVEPTHVALDKSQLNPKTRIELIRIMQAEQGFAMRPFPRGHKGLTLEANGKLEPAGEAYLTLVTNEGLSSKPGDRVVLSDVKIDHSKIIFDLNGGPDRKHRFLRHVQVGTGPMMNPVVQGNDNEPMGARLTLTFENHVPELTGAQVKALLAPLISFDVKTPIQAFIDTLPPRLKEAILSHHVMVGMNTDMVLYAKGQPASKTREIEGQVPFEEWIYGSPPRDVEFVRINGNRVIRLEVAKMGETPVIYTQDEVAGLMRTDGTPVTSGASAPTQTIAEGDVQRNPDTQAPAAPPSLRNPGEKLPDDNIKTGVMRPVQFPRPKPEDASQQTGTTPSQSGPDTSPTAKSAPNSQSASPQPAPAQQPSSNPPD